MSGRIYGRAAMGSLRTLSASTFRKSLPPDAQSWGNVGLGAMSKMESRSSGLLDGSDFGQGVHLSFSGSVLLKESRGPAALAFTATSAIGALITGGEYAYFRSER